MSLITIAVVASHRIHDLPNLLRLPEHAPVDDCIDRRLGCIILVPEGERSIQREPSILGVNVLPYCVHPIDLGVVEIERRVGRAGEEVPHCVSEREVAAAMGPEAVDVRRVRGQVTLELDDVTRVQELVYDVLVAEAGRDVVVQVANDALRVVRLPVRGHLELERECGVEGPKVDGVVDKRSAEHAAAASASRKASSRGNFVGSL